MPKKTGKSRSSKQTKQRRQAKALAVRQDRTVHAVLKATQAALPTALEAGQFRVLTGVHEVVVTLEEIRQRVNTDLVPDGDMPLDDVEQVADMIREEAEMGLVVLHPDGLWRLPGEYLPAEPSLSGSR
ncbi:hypothetical protein [Streptomyces sp. NPDC055105]|uniref:hypothetical protein n=1 Tax=Streptomyces sp. NPDC055105 TaxID=3365719 RepID=UPI0037D3F2F3